MTTNASATTQPHIVRATLLDHKPPAGGRPGLVVLGLPGTDYQLHLQCENPPTPDPFGRVEGRILLQTRRVDVVHTGGRYIEPVYGRPCRIQGSVLQADEAGHSLTVLCVVPFICRIEPRQSPSDFKPGQLVGFAVYAGARFEPLAPEPATAPSGDAVGAEATAAAGAAGAPRR